MKQPRLEFDEEDLKRRPRRRRKVIAPARPRPRPVRPVAAPPALLEAPAVQQCGFCGHRQTILGHIDLCAECGSVISRDESPD